MTTFEISDYQLTKECDGIAQDIVDEVRAELAEDETLEDKRGEMADRAHKTADGHEWVIYNYKALMLCAHCNTDNGEQWIDQAGFQWEQGESTIYSVATVIAYGEMRARIETAIQELIDAADDADAA